MSIGRLQSWLLAWGLSLMLGSTAVAQVSPFAVGEQNDFEFFNQPDLSEYGMGVAPNQGYFGSIEYLLWSTTTPNRAQIGTPDGIRLVYANHGYSVQQNSADTGFIKASLESGTRYEIGYQGEDAGWFFSGTNLYSNSHTLRQYDASMVFAPSFVSVNDGVIGTNLNSPITEPLTIDILRGFIDVEGGGSTATTRNSPDGFADDVDRDNLYGPHGRDRNAPFDGIPDREGGAEPAGAPPITGQTPGPPPASGVGTATNPQQPIDYDDAVPLPLIFDEMTVMHRSSSYSLEINRSRRLRPGAFGEWDVFYGARFVNFSDQMSVNGIGGILSDSHWNMLVDNRSVGGQLGFRNKNRWGRMSLLTEGRLYAGGTMQTARLNGQIGSNLTVSPGPAGLGGTGIPSPTNTNVAAFRLNQPLAMHKTAFSSSRNFASFSPLGELRMKLQYQVFEAVSLNAGWTGTFIDGIMRSPNMIDYTLPAMQISSTQRVQGVFMNGFTMGIEVNR